MKYLIIIPLLISLSTTEALARKKRPKNKVKHNVVTQVDESTITPPKPNEVCFSPENHCDIKFNKFVQSAEKSLDIAIYDVNLDQVVHTILVKAKTMPVRILVDTRQAKGPHSLVSTIKKAGIEVRYGYQRGIMHNKFTIVDGKMLETGSFNYTNGAANKNNENQVYLDTPEIVAAYKDRFEKIWAEALEGQKQKSNFVGSNEKEED
jgi:phosphatidylserine/phosphatidylglycerophosphate/cardiolipin synthase-like enzyme